MTDDSKRGSSKARTGPNGRVHEVVCSWVNGLNLEAHVSISDDDCEDLASDLTAEMGHGWATGSASADLEATAAEAERMRDESDERLRTTLLAIEHDIIAGGNLREILGRIERVVGKPGDPRRGDGLVTPCARPAEESELDSPPFKPLSLTELEARGFKRHGRTIMVGGFAPGNEAPNARAVELRETPSLHDASGHTGVYACSWCDAESKDVATVPHREGCQLAAIVARYLDLAGQSGSPDRGGSP